MSGNNVNLQESFLNHVRREGVVIEVMLLNGAIIQGVIRGFDNFTISMQVGDKHQLIYKHAIAQMISPRAAVRPSVDRPEAGEAGEQPAGAVPAAEELENILAAPAAPHRASRHHPRRREGARRRPDNADGRPAENSTSAERFNSIDFSSIQLNSDEES